MSNEKLPIELKNNQLAVQKRINKRRIEGIKRIGKIALSTGVAVTGLVASTIGGPVATVVGMGVSIGGLTNAGLDIIYKKPSKDSMFVQRKKYNGEIQITQSAKDVKAFQKMKGFDSIEKGAMMGLELLVQLQNIKQKFEDQGAKTEIAQNEKNNVYSQVYSTTTHGINIKTVEALEQLGYLQIERKEPKKKSNLFFEKIGFGQYKEAMQGLLSTFSENENKKHEVQMYDMAFKITDKPMDFAQIYKTYIELNGTKDKNPMRKPIKRLGIIFDALRNQSIDIVKNEIGEIVINYKAQESFSKRMKREQTNSSEKYRKANYIGDKIKQNPVQIQAETKENLAKQKIQDNEIDYQK